MNGVDLANILAIRHDIDRPYTLDVVRGAAPVHEKMAAALAEELGTSPEFWLNLQSAHDESKEAAE